MKVFREDIFTLRVLHSNMIYRIPHKEEDFLPTTLFEFIIDDDSKQFIFKYEKEPLSILFADVFHNEDIKDFNRDYNKRYYHQLKEDLKTFGEGTSNQVFINYICRNAIHFTFTGIENYLFKCFYEFYLKYPEKIQNKEIKLKELIDQDFDGQRVLDMVAYDQAEKIHKTPIKDILYEAKVSHGIDHHIKSQEIDRLEALKQIRNIFTHGDGTITRRYLKKVNPSGYKLGEKYKLSLEMVDYYQSLALEVLKRFDKALIDKYPDFIAEDESNTI